MVNAQSCSRPSYYHGYRNRARICAIASEVPRPVHRADDLDARDALGDERRASRASTLACTQGYVRAMPSVSEYRERHPTE